LNSQIIHFTPVDNRRLSHLCGSLDENLKQIETALDITIVRRNEQFRVSGSAKNLQQGISLLEHFYAMAEEPLQRDDLQLSIIEHTQNTPPAYIEENTTPLRTKRPAKPAILKLFKTMILLLGLAQPVRVKLIWP
jgi:phosphate starvation-inducible PhoH-like protein